MKKKSSNSERKYILRSILNYLKNKGADYADIRKEQSLHESIFVENGIAKNIVTSFSEGCGIRAHYKGGWGFCPALQLAAKPLKDAADNALTIAKASSSLNLAHSDRGYPLEQTCGIKDTYRTNYEIDPFEVLLEKKLDYLFWACQVLRESKSIKVAIAALDFYRTDKLFINTEGSEIEQRLVESGGYIEAVAISGGEVQKRSYPTGHHSSLAQKGYEYVKELDLVGNAQRIRKEAVSLLSADECPQGVKTVIIDSGQLALQIHESCGHAAELDRVLGDEISFAGGSFLTPEKLGKFRYGSKLVNIVADATLQGGVGSFGYDDEGIKAQRIPIINNGIFVGYLSSRESAKRLGLKSSGAMRADGFGCIPLIRMTNVNLQPGDASLEELISDTKDGLFISTNKSWSIDDVRLNFQFGCELAWEIKRGKLGRVFKNPVYTGITPYFWRACSGIANSKYFQLYGIPTCGKGEPVQLAHVGHGASPARFEKVSVGRKR